jgi:hypothetical protein
MVIAGISATLAARTSNVSVTSPGRFESTNMGVIGDSMNGEMFGWIDTQDGRRFVKFDKTSESQARKASAPEPEVKVIYKDRNSAPANDVRSGRIFQRNDKFEKGETTFAVNTKIKYREKENRMLYRIAISALPLIDKNNRPAKCLTKKQESTLMSIYTTPKSNAKLRFQDSDQFWIKDMMVPLNPPAASNAKTSIIDVNKDSCGNKSEVVFHNRANLTLPDFEWIEEGKLLFSGIKFKF